MPVAIRKVIPYFTLGWLTPMLAMTAYPIMAGMRVKSITTPRSLRRSEIMAIATVITDATAYGMTDHSWASLAVYPNSTMIVGSYKCELSICITDSGGTYEETERVKTGQDAEICRST